MPATQISPINEEIHFSPDEIIVSKTDLKGQITYANDVFCRVAEMSTKQVIGKAHSIIRHPDMPRAVFKLLWDTLAERKEIFAYVKNMSATGKYYWVIAHVTPSIDQLGNVIGYHSNRRVPGKVGLTKIIPIYKSLLEEEARHSNRKQALEASYSKLHRLLEEEGKTYSEFVWGLEDVQ